jgi:hypothetical protein
MTDARHVGDAHSLEWAAGIESAIKRRPSATASHGFCTHLFEQISETGSLWKRQLASDDGEPKAVTKMWGKIQKFINTSAAECL